jgi:hypothetical protein
LASEDVKVIRSIGCVLIATNPEELRAVERFFTVVFTVHNLFTGEVISKSKNFKPQKTNTTSLTLLLINYYEYYYHIPLLFLLPPPLLPFLPQTALFRMRINSKNLFMEIKVYVWDFGPSAGPKDKEAAGKYKS